MIDRELIDSGERFALYAVVENRKCHVKKFISELADKDKKKIVRLFQYTVENGPLRNEEKFKKLETRESVTLFEFKAGQVRILCSFDGRSIIVLTHGFIKQQQKTPHTEIDRAFRLLQLYNKRFHNENT